MADARNPLGGGSFDELYRGLQGIAGQLKGELDAYRATASQEGKRAKIEDQRVAREENIQRERNRGAASSQSFESALNAERRLVAEKGIADARAQQVARSRELQSLAARYEGQAAFGPQVPGRFPLQGGAPAPAMTRAEMLRYFGPTGTLPQPPRNAPLPYGVPREFARRMAGMDLPAASMRDEYTRAQPPAMKPGGVLEQARDEERLASGIDRTNKALMAGEPTWRKHGALSTEFFAALRRGEVTLTELRWQLGMTMAKFGGWLVAGAAIYGAVDAFRALKEGALDSLSGVTDLQRIFPNINTQEAQRQFRDLAGHMNLPIKDVADAAYGMSKVFGNLQDPTEQLNATMASTRAVLFAMKVGELDVGTATRYMTAIIQGFGLDWRNLGDLVDYANQAQNRFGGSLPQIIQGTAQAAGQFGALGGSYKDLIALIQTGTRVTGRTGSEIGTALQRTAEILTRPERRQKIINLLGIDPNDHSITEVLQRAMQVVRHSSRETQTEIARTISTPQLASGRILPILRRGQLYNTIRSEVNRSYHGSAETELAVALSGPREQIARLGVTMQRLGSTLAQSGALEGFRVMLGLLNKALSVANLLMQPFTHLPTLLRSSLAVLVEMAVVMRAVRFFRGGPEGPAAGGGGFGGLIAPRGAPYSGFMLPAGRGGKVPTALGDARFMPSSLGSWEAISAEGVQFEERMRRVRIGMANATRTMSRGGLASRTAAIALRGATSAATGFAAGLRSLALTEVSALDGIIIGALVVYDQYKRAQERQREAGEKIKQLDRLASGGTPDQIRAAKRPTPSFFERLSGAYADVHNFVTPWGDRLQPGYRSEQEAYDAAIRRLPFLEQDQSQGRSLELKDVQGNLKRRVAAATTRAQRIAAIEAATYEANNSLAATMDHPSAERKAALAETRDIIAQAKAALIVGVKEFQTTLDGLTDVTSITRVAQELENQTKLYGPSQKRSRRGAALAARARELAARAATPDDAAKFIQQAEQVEQQLAQDAQTKLDRALSSAQTAGQQGVARTTYLRSRYEQLIGQNRARIDHWEKRQRDLRDKNKELDKALSQAEYAQQHPLQVEPGLNSFGGGHLGQMPNHPGTPEAKEAQKVRDRIHRLRSQLKDTQKDEDTVRKHLRDARKEYAQIEREMARQQLTADLEQYDARTTLLQSQTTDPVAKAQIAANRLRDRAAKVRAAYVAGTSSLSELWQAVAAANDAVNAVASEKLQEFQEQQQVQSAQFAASHVGDEQSTYQFAVSQAQSFLNRTKNTKGHTRSQVRQALIALYNARQALSQYLQQQAQDMLSAEQEMALARTEDPIKQAQIRLQFAERALKLARTPAERLRAKAEVLNRRRDVRNTRQQEAYDEIEFESSIGKLTADAELQRLRMLLKTIKGNRDLRRQIQQRIYQLSHQDTDTSFDLDIGSIKMPTVYDVRRGYLAAHQIGANRAVETMTRDSVRGNGGTTAHYIQINIDGGGKHVEQQVFSALDRAGLPARAKARAMGLR